VFLFRVTTEPMGLHYATVKPCPETRVGSYNFLQRAVRSFHQVGGDSPIGGLTVILSMFCSPGSDVPVSNEGCYIRMGAVL
jgi:hypothetical protein